MATVPANRSGIWWRLIFGLSLVALITLMCGNIWIMNQQMNRIAQTSKQHVLNSMRS